MSDCVACERGPAAAVATDVVWHNTSLSRVNDAARVAERNLASAIGSRKPSVKADYLQQSERGFAVANGAGAGNSAYLSVASVIDRVPYEFTVEYEVSALVGKKQSSAESDVIWTAVSLSLPIRAEIRIPLRGVGVVRDGTRVLSVQGYELAADLIPADAGDVLMVIGCLLACAGLTCGWECWAACVTIPSCIACIIACAGANASGIATCIAACRELIEGITS